MITYLYNNNVGQLVAQHMVEEKDTGVVVDSF